MFGEGRYRAGAYHISMDADWEVSDKKIDEYRKEDQKKKFDERRQERSKIESFRETEEMQKAEEIKREADRLAQLKQYKTAIEEYIKALEFYPYKGNEQDLFKNAAEFLFKCNYNMAACYSYLDNFDKAIEFFDKALQVRRPCTCPRRTFFFFNKSCPCPSMP